ncbi:MAG: hypothetical protein PHY45_01840 [Rhodocyclaceae bacterium]|nr:hypothetical protein [Rhodocyclaceae bacterium]
MGLLVNIVAADEDEVEAVGTSQHPVEEWSGIEARDFDTSKLATLHCLLSEDGFDEALYAYEPIFDAGDEGAWVLRIPDHVAEKLAQLDEEALERVGEELAATEEFEMHDWPLEEVQNVVVEMAEIARLAESQGQVMLVWMHPLNT